MAGRRVSVVGLGAWQLGGDWGLVDEPVAHDLLDAAVGAGVTFVDTADVYGDGRSERLIGAWRAARPELDVTVATKMGRRVEQRLENYTGPAMRAWNDRSRANLGVDTLDLVQLHCPPTVLYADDTVFDELDAMVAEGRELTAQWWISAFPGLAILMVALAANFVGDGLRDAIDPKLRLR